mmetsp:Transcript_61450/g.146542  ORF Transcript_61450/g.146542 Transcript_61450/m.146542 type:complete len:216 (-) Transcript_61450:157-804(-)
MQAPLYFHLHQLHNNSSSNSNNRHCSKRSGLRNHLHRGCHLHLDWLNYCSNNKNSSSTGNHQRRCSHHCCCRCLQPAILHLSHLVCCSSNTCTRSHCSSNNSSNSCHPRSCTQWRRCLQMVLVMHLLEKLELEKLEPELERELAEEPERAPCRHPSLPNARRFRPLILGLRPALSYLRRSSPPTAGPAARGRHRQRRGASCRRGVRPPSTPFWLC